MADVVNHPSHYNTGGIEVIDAIEAWGFGNGFNRGNAIKYIARAGRKNPETEIEDLKKARWYIDEEIKRLEGGKIMNIKDISTADLVNELKAREGVTTMEYEPYAEYCVEGTGPAIVMIVED